MYSILHDGFETRYSFLAESEVEAWKIMYAHLVAKHSGLADGMMRDCECVLLEDCDLPHKGEMFNNTIQQLQQQGLEVSFDRDADSIAYYSDKHGNPCLYLQGTSEVCDHEDPDNGKPICMSCALAATSSIFWEGDAEYSDLEDARYVFRFLPAEKHGACHSCMAMLQDS